MSTTRFFDDGHRQALSLALKGIRRHRGRTAADVARKMDMPLRSYEHFEAGAGRFDFAKVQKFAQVLNADPFAILAAVQIGSPALAVRAADSKLMMVLLLGLEDFDRDLGDQVSRIEAAAFLAEFSEAFRRLARNVDKNGPDVDPSDGT